MVLRWLANHHYPAVEQVHIPTENPLKNFLEILDLVRPSTDIKAGWPIGEYVERGLYDYEGAAIVYLLSDGRIFNASQYPQRPRPPADAARYGPTSARGLRQGLRKLCPELDSL